MTFSLITVITIVLFSLELVYFFIADKFNIIDHPNYRSSHKTVTLRGGGIIFVLGLLIYPFFFGNEFVYFIVGLGIIAFISFMDDIKPVGSNVRIIFHLFAVAFMFYQLNLFTLPIYWIILALFLIIGSINAINFMDGINGITGSYALITLCSLLYINNYVSHYVTSSFIIFSIVSVCVFNFFNFRSKAKCFAGDVGSVSIAFIILFFLLKLIITTENFSFLLLLLMYGLDTVTTICFRLIRKEHILEPHRTHFYQYLANERSIPHILVASIYALIQLLINIITLIFIPNSLLTLFILVLCSGTIFVAIRFSTEGPSKLLER